MKQYTLSVDSSACFTEAELAENGILMAHLSYTLDGQQYVDKFENDAEKQKLYDLLDQGHFAQSSKANPASFISAWTPALEQGRDILHLSLSSKVSGSYESACQAADELSAKYGAKIRILDTRTGCFSATELAQDLIAADPMAVDEAYAFAQSRLDNYNLIFTVGDIKFLYKGGRISHVKALFGGLLNLKPILYVSSEGKLTFVMNARGMRQAISMMVEKMKKNATERTTRAYIAHGGNVSFATMLKNKLLEIFPKLKEIRLDYLTPVLGLHAGPGSLVLCFFGAGRDGVLEENPLKEMIDKVLSRHEP